MTEPTAAPETAIVIDGQPHTLDDLTFAEQRELRALVRDLAGDPEIMPGDAAQMDFLPALACVIKRRTQPEFTVEQALELKYGDVISERPTKPAAAKRKPAASGSRATS